eukprot:4364601-Pleurochrysis_carterae.AAC.1
MKEDIVFQGVIEDLDLIAGITEDYTFERAHTQIDNILIPVEMLHTLRATYTAMGVREKDHRIFAAELPWEAEGARGENRPTRRHSDKFSEEHWQKYEQILTERIQEVHEAMGDKRPRDRLRELQRALTMAAAEVLGERAENHTEIGEEADN